MIGLLAGRPSLGGRGKGDESMKKFEVQYQGGQGRYTSEAVDYMIVTVNGIELYAEMENPTWDAEKENSR